MHLQSTNLIDTIRNAWDWTGIDPTAITAANAFGNVIVRSTDGAFWRICPESLWCRVIARTPADLEALWADGTFQQDWQMARIVGSAAAALGEVSDDCCYCLKIPDVLGGKYAVDNFGTISRNELLSASGDLSRQIKDLPDGSRVRLKVIP